MFVTSEDLLILTTGLMFAVFIGGSILHGITEELEYRRVMQQKPVRKKTTPVSGKL